MGHTLSMAQDGETQPVSTCGKLKETPWETVNRFDFFCSKNENILVEEMDLDSYCLSLHGNAVKHTSKMDETQIIYDLLMSRVQTFELGLTRRYGWVFPAVICLLKFCFFVSCQLNFRLSVSYQYV